MSDIVSSIDDISARRSQSRQHDGSSSQRITTGEILVSDAASLLNEMDALTPPVRLQSLQLQGSAYLDTYILWLTLELKYARSNDSAKQDQASAMIAESNSGRNEFQSNIADEGRAQPNQNEANDMLDEINAREANVRTAISDLEFVYNLREP